MSRPMSQPVSQSASDRDPEQVARERAAGEVSAVLLNLDHTLARARRAHKAVVKDGADRNAELALGAIIAELQQVRKRFMQDAVYAGDDLRLM